LKEYLGLKEEFFMVYVFAMSLRFSGLNYVFTGHFSTFRPANREYAALMQGRTRWKRLEAVPILAYGVSTGSTTIVSAFLGRDWSNAPDAGKSCPELPG
jgi:hypothetical protein